MRWLAGKSDVAAYMDVLVKLGLYLGGNEGGGEEEVELVVGGEWHYRVVEVGANVGCE